MKELVSLIPLDVKADGGGLFHLESPERPEGWVEPTLPDDDTPVYSTHRVFKELQHYADSLGAAIMLAWLRHAEKEGWQTGKVPIPENVLAVVKEHAEEMKASKIAWDAYRASPEAAAKAVAVKAVAVKAAAKKKRGKRGKRKKKTS